ncbi:MAG TPA: glutathione synthase [bacterium]|nr:glutathione synthase [bacterium]
MKILGILDPLKGPNGPYNLRKDSSHLLLLEFQRRGHAVFVSDPQKLGTKGREVRIRANPAAVLEKSPYFRLSKERLLPASAFDLIVMRKDPPVDGTYLRAARLLSRVPSPTWVCNAPRSLARWNEKLIILEFPDWIPPTRVTADAKAIGRFAQKIGGTVVLKSLSSFGGRGVERADTSHPHFDRIVRKMTRGGRAPVMVQAFLPEVSRGEKRIFLIDGRPLGALRRIPPPGGFLANPDLGARLRRTRLSAREKRLCARLGPFLRRNGIFFAGADVIGEKLTEVNITSPGMLWEWNETDGKRHERQIVDLFEDNLRSR